MDKTVTDNTTPIETTKTKTKTKIKIKKKPARSAEDLELSGLRKHGPEKEKVQITIRIDKQLMDNSSGVIRRSQARLTDVLERGLYLAAKELDQSLPPLTHQVRFLVANATKPQQVFVRRFMCFLVYQERRDLPSSDRLICDLILKYLESLDQVPGLAEQAAALYSRYGRSAEEAAGLLGS